MGLEPTPSGVTGRRYNQLNYDPKKSLYFKLQFFQLALMVGGTGTRTCDIHGVSVALSQLSYPPAIPQKRCEASSNIDYFLSSYKNNENLLIHRLRTYRHIRFVTVAPKFSSSFNKSNISALHQYARQKLIFSAFCTFCGTSAKSFSLSFGIMTIFILPR